MTNKIETQILSGREILDCTKAGLKSLIKGMPPENIPELVIVTIGNDPSSAVYVRNKIKIAEEIGFVVKHILCPEESTTDEVNETIHDHLYNMCQLKFGVIIQQPVPDHIDMCYLEHTVLNKFNDVDGFSDYNIANLFNNSVNQKMNPCTPRGIMNIFDYYNIDVSGKHAVIIGRSTIVGKPMALELINADATVTVCHSKTENLNDYISQADIIISAVGKPQFIKGSDIKEDAVCIDVGINVLESNGPKRKIVGDFDLDSCIGKASAITPVPGGVGLTTVAALMDNVYAAAIVNTVN